jgi:hypothetical protein
MTDTIQTIDQILNKYCHTVDRGSAKEVSNLFSQEAVLKPYFDDQYEVSGRAEIERWYAHYMENFRAKIRHLKHMVVSPVITVTNTRASSICYFIASAVNTETNQGFSATGTYEDQFEKSGDSWMFSERCITVETTSPEINVTEQFPSLEFPRK